MFILYQFKYFVSLFIHYRLKPIILTMWDQFVTNESAAIAQIITTRPVIMAIRLKVVSHNGKLFSKKKKILA